MRFALLFAVLAAPLGLAQSQQPSQCQTKCNLNASECMKACVGDPKDAQRPETANRIVNCMKSCEAQNNSCKTTCGGR